MRSMLRFHLAYRCRDSGACCSSGWPIPVEATLLPHARRGDCGGAPVRAGPRGVRRGRRSLPTTRDCSRWTRTAPASFTMRPRSVASFTRRSVRRPSRSPAAPFPASSCRIHAACRSRCRTTVRRRSTCCSGLRPSSLLVRVRRCRDCRRVAGSGRSRRARGTRCARHAAAGAARRCAARLGEPDAVGATRRGRLQSRPLT